MNRGNIVAHVGEQGQNCCHRLVTTLLIMLPYTACTMWLQTLEYRMGLAAQCASQSALCKYTPVPERVPGAWRMPHPSLQLQQPITVTPQLACLLLHHSPASDLTHTHTQTHTIRALLLRMQVRPVGVGQCHVCRTTHVDTSASACELS